MEKPSMTKIKKSNVTRKLKPESYIKQKLQSQLLEIENELNYTTSNEEGALLHIAKSNILLGLQKYED